MGIGSGPVYPVAAPGRRRLPGTSARGSVRVMRSAYRADNLFDAHLVKDALEAEGIPAFIAGEYLTGGVGQLPAVDYLAVMVPESGMAAASGIVHRIEAQLSEARIAIDAYGDAPDGPLIVPA